MQFNNGELKTDGSFVTGVIGKKDEYFKMRAKNKEQGIHLEIAPIISAPLSKYGWDEYVENGCATILVAGGDLLIHISLWVVAFILEVWCTSEAESGKVLPTNTLKEFGSASFWALVTSLIGMAFVLLFGILGGKVGQEFATTYAAVVGGAYASIAFTILWVIQASGWSDMNAQYLDNAAEDGLKLQRQCMLWSLALKTIATVVVTKNATFWGHAKSKFVETTQTTDTTQVAGGP